MNTFIRFSATAVVLAIPPLASAQSLAEAVTTQREMVVTANPLATAAGADILKQGGNAVDAMIAVQAVLGLVEPQSSGIGGGAFVLYHDAASGELVTVDARETAPIAATEDRFSELGFLDAWQSGLSVGVPGVPAMMELLHDHYGSKPWQRLFRPAQTLALGGYEMTGRTADQVNSLLSLNPDCVNRLFFRDSSAFAYFTNGDTEDCAAKPAGTVMRNPEYADLMKILSKEKASGFYSGPVAEAVIGAVQADPNIPGDMTLEDLETYVALFRDPVCIEYRSFDVCGMGPPSSGGLAVGQILGILENFDLGDDPLAVDAVHLFTQAGRLAFADRNLYVGDADYVTVPVEGMLDEHYLASRADLITDTDLGTADPGVPPGEFDPTGPDLINTDNGTSHVSIVDRYGNALSMTTTIESSFGNGVMVPGYGFLLNNELTDFSFTPVDGSGMPVANRVQSGKRPRSSMSPSIVFDAVGDLFLVTGSPGGSRIIGYTAQSVMNVIDFGLDPQEAINVPHYMNRNGRTDLEIPIPGVTLDYDPESLRAALEVRGHPVGVIEQTSGLSMIEVGDGLLVGGADKRRDGTVGGR